MINSNITVRIDKFLWCIRFYKTRNLAAEACKKNRVWVNNILVKASKEIMISDIIKIRKDQINYTIEIIQIPNNRLAAKSLSLYIIDKTNKEEIEALKVLRLSQDYYHKKGLGRPTKKDRRDIDSLFNSKNSSSSKEE